MKEKLRIFTTLILTLIYSFAVSITVQSVFLTDNRDAGNSEQETYLLTVSAGICGTALPKDVSSFNKPGLLSVCDIKKPFTQAGLLQTTELLIRSTLTQYEHFFSNLLISFRKTDKIFPFHYFW